MEASGELERELAEAGGADAPRELSARLRELLGAELRRGEDGDHVRTAHGWRRELVGEELRDLVAGRVALSAGPNGGLSVTRSD